MAGLGAAHNALARFGLPEGCTALLINRTENATYRIVAPGGQAYALRIHRLGYHSRAAIASELAWAVALRAAEVALTPRPVQGIDGAWIQDIPFGPDHELHRAVLFDWEEGREPGIGDDLARPFQTLGEIAARMHGHARAWLRPPWFERLHWDFASSLGDARPHWGKWRDGAGVDQRLADLFGRTTATISRRLAAYGNGPGRYGLIHADHRLANLLVDGARVKVLDFDDCGFGWFMYDAATPLSFHEHEPQAQERIEAWKEGYRRAAPLSREDEAEIPTFVMFRRLLLVAWIGSHAETDLARSLGIPYTEQTAGLCEAYLQALA